MSSAPYRHEFLDVRDAAEYLKAALAESEEAFLTATGKVMEHGEFESAQALAAANLRIELLTKQFVSVKAERDVLRGVDCGADGDGPCGVCVKCLTSKLAQLRDVLENPSALTHCCFCGTYNVDDPKGYAGERACHTCGHGGQGEARLPQMACEAWNNRRAALASAPAAVDQWIPVSERLPEWSSVSSSADKYRFSDEVLAWPDSAGDRIIATYWSTGKWGTADGEPVEPKAWQPLPAPPQPTQEQERGEKE